VSSLVPNKSFEAFKSIFVGIVSILKGTERLMNSCIIRC